MKNWGATISARNHIGHNDIGHVQQDDIGHNRKPYPPHGKSISATKYMVSLLHVYIIVSYSCFVSSLSFCPVTLSSDVTYSLVYFIFVSARNKTV